MWQRLNADVIRAAVLNVKEMHVEIGDFYLTHITSIISVEDWTVCVGLYEIPAQRLQSDLPAPHHLTVIKYACILRWVLLPAWLYFISSDAQRFTQTNTLEIFKGLRSDISRDLPPRSIF